MSPRQQVAASLKALGHKVDRERVKRMLWLIAVLQKHLRADRKLNLPRPVLNKQLRRVAKAARRLEAALSSLTPAARKAVEPVIVNDESVFSFGSRLSDLQDIAREFNRRAHPTDFMLWNYLNGCAHAYRVATHEWPRHFYDHDKQSMSAGHPFFGACLDWAGEPYASWIVRKVIEQRRPRRPRKIKVAR